MDHKIQLDLLITGFDSEPDEISKLLGIIPSRTWKKGDVISKSIRQRKENGWELSSGLSKEEDFESHLNTIIQIIGNSVEKFNQLPKSSFVELSCAVWLQSESEFSLPSINLNVAAIQFLNAINSGIDFDLYIVPKD